MNIRAAVPEDATWIQAIWEPFLGAFSMIWWRYWNRPKANDYWIVVQDSAFAHYTIRLTGVKSLHEIGVAQNQRRLGYGRALLDTIGTPITLKTDCDNAPSNAFYRAYGMLPAAKTQAKSGKWMMIYEKW